MQIQAFGSLAIDNFDKLEQEFAMAPENIELAYKRFTKDWFVLSGVDKDGRIVYRKTIKKKIDYMGRPGTAVFQTWMITYPASQNKSYRPYCSSISKGL